MADKQRIGFIGAGLMGHGMAKNIVEKGYPLTVLGHRNRQPIDDLIGRGAREAKTPKELAQQSDIVITCVTGSPQVEELVFKKDGLLEGLRAGMIVADATTAEPTSTMKVAAAVIEAGARFADIPLIRTPKEAEAGTLGVMVGSDAALLAELKPVLETFANAIFHAGPLGAGHKLKLINNYIALAAAAAAAEGIATAKKAGVDLKALTDIVIVGRRQQRDVPAPEQVFPGRRRHPRHLRAGQLCQGSAVLHAYGRSDAGGRIHRRGGASDLPDGEYQRLWRQVLAAHYRCDRRGKRGQAIILSADLFSASHTIC